MGARIAPPLMEATDASRLVCVVVVSYQEYSLTHSTIVTSAPLSRVPRNPRSHTQSTCVMHALRAGRGAHCPSVFVCVAHLSLEMTALFIYLLSARLKVLSLIPLGCVFSFSLFSFFFQSG